MTKAQSLSRECVALVNVERRKLGRRPLRSSRLLRLSARAYAIKLVRSRTFGHAPRIEGPTEDRWRWLGEVLALGYLAPASVVAAWMASDAHKAILLSPKARSMGFAVAGRRSGRATWVGHFGRRWLL